MMTIRSRPCAREKTSGLISNTESRLHEVVFLTFFVTLRDSELLRFLGIWKSYEEEFLKTRKNARSDLAFLRNFASKGRGSRKPHPMFFDNKFDTTEKKLELRWQIQERYPSPLTETKIRGPMGDRKSLHGIPIEYDYQR